MRDTRREVGETTLVDRERLVADLDFEAPFERVDCLLLFVVDVERRPALLTDLDDEVVESAAGVLPGDLEDEISSWAGLKP